MMRAQSRNLLALQGAVLAAAAVLLSLFHGAAVAAETRAERYCAVLIGTSVEGRPSPTLARACDDTSATQARAKMRQVAADNGVRSAAVPLADTLLMTWYSNIDYTGATYRVYGTEGPCDSAGYRIDAGSIALGVWGQILSSIRGAGPCNRARVANRAGTASQTFNLPVRYLGSLLNDNVGIIWVYNR